MPRPSLSELAARRAEQRLSKKDRNAELRRYGYNPDGDDGRVYRRAFATATQSHKMARVTTELSEVAHVVLLWEFPAADWPDAVAAGVTDMPLGEYRQRLDVVERELIAAGRSVLRVPATVADMLAALSDNDLSNDPAGRAAALALIHREAHQ